MMVLGIDTSNYTTSAAAWFPEEDRMDTASRLLPVRPGSLGLRQSEAVFHHTAALDGQIAAVMELCSETPSAIGVSVRPRDGEDSYMPCFTVGKMLANALGATLKIPVFSYSHQAGHVAAAAYGSGHPELLERPFLAFHFSGGTTDALLITPEDKQLNIRQVAGSLDLKAGQAVDRVGGMLGLEFPAGKALDPLAMCGQSPYRPKAVMRGADCSLSGIENQCRKLVDGGTAPCDVARFCMESILAAARSMTIALREIYGDLPILYAGGVMSNTLLQQSLGEEFGGYFAPPRFSSDNAAGVAYLAGRAVYHE